MKNDNDMEKAPNKSTNFVVFLSNGNPILFIVSRESFQIPICAK